MRDWIALHTGVLDSDTWADLGEWRLAWIVTLLLAAQQNPEGEFDSAAKLIRLLTKEDVALALEAYDEMTRAGCLEDVEGRIRVRGWERWQRRLRGASDDPDREALRKREAYWRAKAEDLAERLASGPTSGNPPQVSEPSPDVSVVSGQKRREEKRREETRREDGPPARAREADGLNDDEDALDTFYLLTMVRPWGRPSGRWLGELQDGYGITAVQEVLQAEWKRDPKSNTLLSRAEAALAKRADRVRSEKAAEAKQPKPRASGRTDAERAILNQMIQEAQG